MFKRQAPSKYFLPIETFSSLLKILFEHVDFDAFYSVSAIFFFLFHLFHISKTFPFEDFFFVWETKKSRSWWNWLNRESGAQASGCFWSKPAGHSELRWCREPSLSAQLSRALTWYRGNDYHSFEVPCWPLSSLPSPLGGNLLSWILCLLFSSFLNNFTTWLCF